MKRVPFGFEQVTPAEKAARVDALFSRVAVHYDRMNDLMSFGCHRLWKRFAATQSGLRPGQEALDVASGSGDLAKLLAPRVAPHGRLVMSDRNQAMLARGRARMLDAGFTRGVDYVLADAADLPFDDERFNCVSIAFGLRNVARQERALAEMYRCLAPGGRLLVLEFSKPTSAGVERLYDGYSFRVLPALGEWVAGQRDSYRYLVESIRRHPDQAAQTRLMEQAGFADVRVHNLAFGIVALHVGYRY